MNISKVKESMISALMIFGAITLAGGALLLLIEPSDAERNINNVEVDWSQVKDDPSQELEISWLGIAAYRGASQESWIKKNLDKIFNVNIKSIFMDWGAFKKKKPLMLASGDVPDVIWDGDPLGVRTNIRNGFVMEVPYDIILKYAPVYSRRLYEHGKEAWLYSAYKGKNYGLPTFIEGGARPRLGTWRKDWLESVGIHKVPETIAEMEEALRRFRHNDPDKNGVKDTYGWSPNISHWSVAYSEVFAAYDILPFEFIKRGDGIVWGGVQPECKKALETLRRWHRDGLLHPDFIGDINGTAAETKFLNGKVGYTYPVDTWHHYDLEDSGSMASKLSVLSAGGQMVASPPLRNQKGKRVGRSWGGAAHVIQFGAHLCRSPEKVIRVLKMMEAITVNESLYLETRSGKEGLHWKLDPGRGIQLLEPYLSNKLICDKELLSSSGLQCLFYYPSSLDMMYHKKYLKDEVIRFDTENRPTKWGMVTPLGKTDILPSTLRYVDPLRDWQQQIFVKIISGDLPLEYFDTYVKKWEERGGKVLTEEANEMKHTQEMIYAKVGALK